MGTWIFLGVVALVVVALLALDWFVAGHSRLRRGKSVDDVLAGNPNPGYASIQTTSFHDQQKSP